MIEIIREPPNAWDCVEALHRAAFGEDEGVDKLVSSLRSQVGSFDTISLVARQNGVIVGHIMACSGWVDAPERLHDVMILSPLGVLPSYQGQGIGRSLIHALCESVAQAGCKLLFLEGNPKYYASSGFERGTSHGFKRPSPRIPDQAFQVRILDKSAELPQGRLVYPDAFWRHDAVGLR